MAIPDQLQQLGRYRIKRALDIAAKGDPDGIGGELLLAIGSRESGMRNIVGDSGHGRGWLQIDDRYHQAWLADHLGCKSGSWWPSFTHSALDGGYCPRFSDACWRAISLLRTNRQFAKNRGVPDKYLTRFAVAAYNAGATGALRGWREHGDFDHFTTGGDYSDDVIGRRAEVARWLVSNGYR
jgi:hypothetical protein